MAKKNIEIETGNVSEEVNDQDNSPVEEKTLPKQVVPFSLDDHLNVYLKPPVLAALEEAIEQYPQEALKLCQYASLGEKVLLSHIAILGK